MASKLLLAGNWIPAASLLPGDTEYGHLAIVLDDGNSLREVEVQAPNPITIPFGGNFQYPDFGRNHVDPENTPFFGDPFLYRSTEITLRDGQTANDVWEILRQVHAQFAVQGAGINYSLDQNSNAYANTLLKIIGVELGGIIAGATPIEVEDGFPSSNRDLLTDFSGTQLHIALNLQGGETNDFIRTGDGRDTVLGAEGDDTLITGSNDGSLSGGDGNDLLEGGAGADTLDGGEGVDTAKFAKNGGAVSLTFDVSGDGKITGTGTGGDAEGDTYTDVEAFIGTDSNDTFSLETNELPTPILISGGDGNDKLILDDVREGDAPVVFWGGAGSDEIINDDRFGSLQVMVVEVPNVTEDNFSRFTLDMLGMGSDFDWSMIDVILVNPDSSDRLINSKSSTGDYEYEVGNQSLTFQTGATFEIDANGFPSQTGSTTQTVSFFGLRPGFDNSGGRRTQTDDVVSTFNVDFGSGTHEVFGHVANMEINQISILLDDGTPVEDFPSGADYTGEDVTTDFQQQGEGDLDSTEYENRFWVDYEARPDNGNYLISERSEWGHRNFDNLSDIPTFTSEGSLNFLVLGGSLSGSQIISDGRFVADIPPPEEDNDNNENGNNGGDEDSNDTNFRVTVGGSGAPTGYDGFDDTANVVVIDGAPIDPNAPPPGTTVEQVGSDVRIVTAVGSVLLTNVSLATWQATAQDMTLGTSGDDNISLSSTDDIVSTGAGSDTVSSNHGDDLISYHSGDDVINGGTGNDTLDLSQYASNEVTFRHAAGHDVLVETPDGVIELHYQGRYVVGNSNTNIETLVFANATIGDAEIRQRALDDQNTSGDDYIRGTLNADAVTTGAGNDTVDTFNGDDTISYGSGDDQIIGGVGQDTLDLSQYASDEVTFRHVGGHDVLIETPDGTIELHYQARYAVGHSRTNIETLVFSDGTLDDAGIRQRAMDDQNTIGDDNIRGTLNNDIATTSAGSDTVNTMNGDDTIFYGSGNDQIIGGAGYDTLDLSQYSSDQVTFSNLGRDVMIATPDGTIELHDQSRNPLGHSQSNIESLVFSDLTLDDAGLRQRALDDQNTAGNDLVVGTQQADQISGGAGNDTLDGYGGADTFVFAPGDGVDEISDFEDGTDLIRFESGPTGIGDLTISGVNGDAVIAYNGTDSVQLTGVSSLDLTEDDFQFV